MKIDYSALHEPITEADRANYRYWRRSNVAKFSLLRWEFDISRSIILYLVIAFFSLYIVISALSGIANRYTILPGYISFTSIGVAVCMLAATIFAAAIRRQANRTVEVSVRQFKFAKQNDIHYIQDQSNPVYSGMIFDQGDLRKLAAAYIFPDGTHIGNYSYFGEDNERHSWGFASLPLPTRLPHMMLDSRKNNLFGGKHSNLPVDLRGQELSLEGNFDSYFTLYVPKHYKRDALYVFTPDVMTVMIDSGQSYDIEVINDRLLLYTQGQLNLSSAYEISKLMTVIDELASEIRPQAARYSAESTDARLADIPYQERNLLPAGRALWRIILLIVTLLTLSIISLISYSTS